MSWLSGWNYRKSVTLSRASGAVTNYQMKLLVGESSGATGEDVDCGGHCATDFDDVRFTTSDGEVLLDYWIESISGTSPNQLATVWIEFDYIETTDTTFYMYYGNSEASSYSNGVATFIFFEDFNSLSDGALNGQNGWSGSTNFDVQTSVKQEGTKAVEVSVGGASTSINHSISVNSYNMFIQCHIASSVVSGVYCVGFYVLENTSRPSGVYISGLTFVHLTPPATWRTFDGTPVNNTFYKFKLAFDSASTHKIWKDDVLQTLSTYANYQNVSSTINGIRFEQYSNTTAVGYFDIVFVGQYLVTEPVWGNWGDAEEAATEFNLIGVYNIVPGTSGVFTSIWSDSNTNINSGKIYVGTKGEGGSLSVINMVDKSLYDYYLIDKPGRCNEVLDSENIEDINVVI